MSTLEESVAGQPQTAAARDTDSSSALAGGGAPGLDAPSPSSAHLDFKREGAGWLVWCEGAWREVSIFADDVSCFWCNADIADRLVA